MRRLPESQVRRLAWSAFSIAVPEAAVFAANRRALMTPTPTLTPEGTSIAPLRSYLFLLAPRTRSRGSAPIVHYVLEESPERAIQVCGQEYPERRIVSIRDVTDSAAAA
jgi:hypothetical protein